MRLFKTNILVTSLSVVVIVTVSGCADIATKTNAIKSTIASKTSSYSLTGCATGAAAGIGTSLLLGGNKNTAIAGAVVGCASGIIIGIKLAKRTDQYANANQALDKEIKLHNNNINQVRKYNKKLSTDINNFNRKISQLRKTRANNQEKQLSLKNIKSTVKKQRDSSKRQLIRVTKEVNIAQNKYNKYKGGLNAIHSKKWHSKLANLKKEKTILSSNIKTLTALTNSI